MELKKQVIICLIRHITNKNKTLIITDGYNYQTAGLKAKLLKSGGKLSYQGPVSPRTGGLPRIKLDLTADEKVVLPPVQKQIFHP